MTELGKIWDLWIRDELFWVMGKIFGVTVILFEVEVELDAEATILFNIVLLTSAFVTTVSSMVNDSTSVVVEGFFVDEDFFSGI